MNQATELPNFENLRIYDLQTNVQCLPFNANYFHLYCIVS